MDLKYLDFKKEIEKINQRVKEYLWKKWYSFKIKKSDARPFKVSEGITMMVIDPSTGQKAKFSSKDTIIEAYKNEKIVDGKVLYLNKNRLDSNNILKFY